MTESDWDHQKLVTQTTKFKLKWLLFDNFYVTKPFSRALTKLSPSYTNYDCTKSS